VLYCVDDVENVLVRLAQGRTPRLARFQAWRLLLPSDLIG
jgi:hypothetical protein